MIKNSNKSLGYDKLKISYGVHTVYTTIPYQTNSRQNNIKRPQDNDNKTQFEIDIEKFYFDDFRTDCKFDFDSQNENPSIDYNLLYKPLKFFMLGDNDLLYITLINNFKFSHRLFEPITTAVESDFVYNAHTFKCYSGYVLNQNNQQINKIFNSVVNKEKEAPVSYFVGAINLKLNNGLFIGNGLFFLETVYNQIEKKLNELGIQNYLINQTFSWFELSLFIFIDKAQDLTDCLQHLRALTLKDLDNHSEIAKDSLYNELIENAMPDSIYDTSLFADTNSHFGFNERLIRKTFKHKNSQNDYDEYVNQFYANFEDEILKTEIEWQVKPGHIFSLIDNLKENTFLSPYFFDENLNNFTKTTPNMVLGKCDYYISENSKNSIMSNFHLIRYIARDNKIFNHIRKVRTYIFFEKLEYLEQRYQQTKIKTTTENVAVEKKSKNQSINWSDHLEALAVKNYEFKKYNNLLVKLKVSRQIRNKILKIFSNFNNGILDPIQFTYFLDFVILIKKMKVYIEHEANENDSKTKMVHDIEKHLVDNYIKNFQEAYNVRFLNGYQFESISDFDLDQNNSIQQLLSSYGLFVHEFGNSFFDKKSLYGPVVQLNDLDTVSDIFTINYAVHHFTSPEFIFTTLTKEILNSLIKEQNIDFNKINIKLAEEINESYFDDLVSSGNFDLFYFIIDVIRYFITFGSNFRFYQHWIWSYNFQNTSLYDTDGMLNEQHLKTELLRLLLIQKYIRFEYFKENPEVAADTEIQSKLSCPISHLDAYWFLHFEKLDDLSTHIFEKHSSHLGEIFKFINEQLRDDNFSKDVGKSATIKKIIKDCLSEHYKMNNKKIEMLKRDWKNGTISQNNYDREVLYAIDQIGSQYFYNIESTQKYFEFNVNVINAIIDFSTVYKKDFICLHITKE